MNKHPGHKYLTFVPCVTPAITLSPKISLTEKFLTEKGFVKNKDWEYLFTLGNASFVWQYDEFSGVFVVPFFQSDKAIPPLCRQYSKTISTEQDFNELMKFLLVNSEKEK